MVDRSERNKYASPAAHRLADRITQYRATHGLSQRAFGALVGRSAASVGAWERGSQPPIPRTMAELNRVMGAEPDASKTPAAILTQARADLAAALNVPVESVALEMKLTA